MVPFNQTPTYLTSISHLEATIESIASELEVAKLEVQAHPTKKKGEPVNLDKVAAQKKRDNLKSKLETRRAALARFQALNVPLWNLVELLSAASEELWTPEQADTWSRELSAHEGRGEKALRIRYGITQVAHNDDCDIIRADGSREEVKNLQGRTAHGQFNVQDIQTGHHGRKTYTRWMGVSAEAGLFRHLSDEFRDAIFCGEVPGSLLYYTLPEETRTALHEVLRPSNVLGYYDRIVGTMRFGSITVPKADFDVAWSLKAVTKSGPKYTLRKQYVLDRLQQTLVNAAVVAA